MVRTVRADFIRTWYKPGVISLAFLHASRPRIPPLGCKMCFLMQETVRDKRQKRPSLPDMKGTADDVMDEEEFK